MKLAATLATEQGPRSSQPARPPLPSKLSFEQNLTNLIEKESPLLHSELLTAEHELSVLRSRLAVNEGVTAITGTILESLKGQFDSPSRKTVEIHYDSQPTSSPYLVVRAINSFWLAQPIPSDEVAKHLQQFSSPVMKRATLSSDSESERDEVRAQPDSSSEEDEDKSPSEQQPNSDVYEQHIAEIHGLLNEYKDQPFTSEQFMHLSTKVIELKFFLHLQQFNEEDKARIESECDNLIEQISQGEDDEQAIDFFERSFQAIEQRIDELFHAPPPPPPPHSTKHPRLIPEDPVITHAVFYEEDHPKQKQKKIVSPSRLISEDARVNAENFYEGDRHSVQEKSVPSSSLKQVLIPESPLVSSDVFYEGDAQRSLFTERSSTPFCIDNLREIMSDLMLAASWSRKPLLLDSVEEIQAESFISTEETSLCQITHEIENFSITVNEAHSYESRLMQISSELVEEILQQAAVTFVDEDLSSDDDEGLMPPISAVLSSRSTEELGSLVQELQTLSEIIPRRYSVCSSSSSDSEISLPALVSPRSFRDLNTLLSELESIEDRLEEQWSVPPPSDSELNELGGLINELNRVTKQLNTRAQEEIFTSSNIAALSHDLSQYRRDSLSRLHSIDEQRSEEERLVRQMIELILREAQEILVKEVRRATPTLSHFIALSHSSRRRTVGFRRLSWNSRFQPRRVLASPTTSISPMTILSRREERSSLINWIICVGCPVTIMS